MLGEHAVSNCKSAIQCRNNDKPVKFNGMTSKVCCGGQGQFYGDVQYGAWCALVIPDRRIGTSGALRKREYGIFLISTEISSTLV
jgi:hypothetical protein